MMKGHENPQEKVIDEMKVLTYALAFVTLSNAQWVDPNNITNYLTKEGIQRLEASFRISSDLSKVRFYLYTPEHGSENHWIFKAGVNPQDLLDHGFNKSRPTKFISHGWTAGAAGWVDNFAAGYFSHPQLYCNVIGNVQLFKKIEKSRFSVFKNCQLFFIGKILQKLSKLHFFA